MNEISIPDDKNLSHKDLQGADLSEVDLSRANLECTNLSGAVLKQASLARANLKGANLEGANFEHAVLQSADLRNANLKDANLAGTYSRWADFRGSNLDNANLQGAVLEAARFEKASLENIDLTGISYDRATSWPDGFKPHKMMRVTSPLVVVTVNDLIDFLSELSQSQAIDCERTLEEYLCALLGAISRYKEELVSANLIARLFAEAFLLEPVAFDESWRRYESLFANKADGDNYGYLRHIILTQIMDLHTLSEKDNINNIPHDWNNLSIEDYLSCASWGFGAHSKNLPVDRVENASYQTNIGRNLKSSECTWRDMADIMTLGKVYE